MFNNDPLLNKPLNLVQCVSLWLRTEVTSWQGNQSAVTTDQHSAAQHMKAVRVLL